MGDSHTHTFALPDSKQRFYTTGSSQHHTREEHGAHSTAAQMQIQAAYLPNKYFLSQDLNSGIPHPQPKALSTQLHSPTCPYLDSQELVNSELTASVEHVCLWKVEY